jgi:DNA repair protein RecO (recombination protein O)
LPSKASEAFTLRTYPYREADLIVSFFTRDQGRLRGVARRARRPKSNFGSGLERLSQIKMFYFQRESVELVRLDSCDLIQSQFGLSSDYPAGVALDFLAEVSEQLLPPAEPNEKYFRLLMSVLEHVRAHKDNDLGSALWTAITYFSLWAVRLSGFLPDMQVSDESRGIVLEMFEKPISQLPPRTWKRETALDLRRALVRSIEQHIERRLLTVAVLETL